MRVHRALDRDAADLTLAHRVMAVTEREEGALDVDAEIDGRPGAGFRGIHVAAECFGYQDVAGLVCGRGNADRAMERLQRQADRVVRVERLIDHLPGSPVDGVDPRPLRQRVLKRCRVFRAGQGAEQRKGRADRPVACRLHVDEMDRKGVAGLGAFDVEGAGLRVDEGVRDRAAREVLDRPDPAAEAVLGEQVEDVAGLDALDRLAAAERPRVLVLRRHEPANRHVLGHRDASLQPHSHRAGSSSQIAQR